MKLSDDCFGVLDDGRRVQRYQLCNDRGASIDIMDLGATILSMRFPDRHGALDDIVLGYDSPQAYLAGSHYLGAVVGRYANRIREGRFTLEGVDYHLAANNGPNALHGGLEGFDRKLWRAEPFTGRNRCGLRLSLLSEDGDQGYPGRLLVFVTYTLNNHNQLLVDYQASVDKATPINLTQHTYFNLNGHNAGDITGHALMLNADAYTPVNAELIPTGAIAPVAGTALDFRAAKPIGRDIAADCEQIRNGTGFDHNWVLNRTDERGKVAAPGRPTLAAWVYAPESGRVLKVFTDQPGIQFYSGNFLDASRPGKQGAVYGPRQGFCLETQHYPDSPNQQAFPSTVLRPGETFLSRTVFELGVKT